MKPEELICSALMNESSTLYGYSAKPPSPRNPFEAVYCMGQILSLVPEKRSKGILSVL